LFADDTNIFLHHSDLNILKSMSNVELDKLSEWFKSNRLSLNIKKTNYIFMIVWKMLDFLEYILMRNYNGMNILIKFQRRSKKYWYSKENKSPSKYICVVTIV